MCQIYPVRQKVFSPLFALGMRVRSTALLVVFTLYCGVYPTVFTGNQALAESSSQKSASNQSVAGFTVQDCSFRLWSKNQDLVFEYERLIDRAQVLSHRYDAESQVLALQFNCPARIKAKAFRTGLAKFPQIAVSSTGKQFTISVVTASEQADKRPTEPEIDLQKISVQRLRIVLTPVVEPTLPNSNNQQESPQVSVTQQAAKLSEPDDGTNPSVATREVLKKDADKLRSKESEKLSQKRLTEQQETIQPTPSSEPSSMADEQPDESLSTEKSPIEDASAASQTAEASTDSLTGEIDATNAGSRRFEQEAVRLPQPEVLDQSNSERLGVPLVDSTLIEEKKNNDNADRGKQSAQKVGKNSQSNVREDKPLRDKTPAKERFKETLTVAKKSARQDSIQAEGKPKRPALQERREQQALREREEAQRALAELRRTTASNSTSYQQISEHGPFIALFAGIFFVCGTIMLLWYRSRISGRQRERARLYAEDAALHQDLSECYSLLGVRRTDSIDVIKKRYKHLVKVFHSDRLVSESLPEEMRSLANERFQQIQEAYEKIRERRGF